MSIRFFQRKNIAVKIALNRTLGSITIQKPPVKVLFDILESIYLTTHSLISHFNYSLDPDYPA